MNYKLYLVLLLLVASDIHGILIRSVQLHHAQKNKTILFLHDMHAAQQNVITEQLKCLQHLCAEHPECAVLVEAPPLEDAYCVQSITENIKAIMLQAQQTIQSFPTQVHTYFQAQQALGSWSTEPLLSVLGHTMQDPVVLCDHRALLFALSDLIAVCKEMHDVSSNLCFTVQQLTHAIYNIEQLLTKLRPIIDQMPLSLIPVGYATCLQTLRYYQTRLTSMPAQANLFSLLQKNGAFASDINNFFSWLMTSQTFCNFLLEAMFIQKIIMSHANLCIIVTGAFHAERLQHFFMKSGYVLEHDSGIIVNKKITHQSYDNVLLNIISKTSYASIIAPLQTLLSSIQSLDCSRMVIKYNQKIMGKCAEVQGTLDASVRPCQTN